VLKEWVQRWYLTDLTWQSFQDLLSTISSWHDVTSQHVKAGLLSVESTLVLFVWLINSCIVDAMQVGKRVVDCQLPELPKGFNAAWYRTQECQMPLFCCSKRRRMLLGYPKQWTKERDQGNASKIYAATSRRSLGLPNFRLKEAGSRLVIVAACPAFCSEMVRSFSFSGEKI
jgi:hypothetical protein